MVFLNNQISSLDVSNNINLTYLECTKNGLSSLDVSNNINLTKLICDNNQLTSLDVSNNINLTELLCYNNQLTSLDFSNNIGLNILSCSNNQLSNLDISNNINLGYLDCVNNKLTSLDVSNTIYLPELWCSNNQLISINIKNGSGHFVFSFYGNPNLQYICADSMELVSVQNLIQFYGVPNVVVDTLCTSVSIAPSKQTLYFRCFPNPAQNTLTIESKTSTELVILNSIGEVIREISVLDKLEVDISALPEGIYFLKNETGGMSFVKE